MPQSLCAYCISHEYCRKIWTPLTSEDCLSSPVWISNFRVFCFNLRIPRRCWAGYLHNLYRDLRGRVYVPDRDVGRAEVELFMDVFDGEGIEYWFGTFCNTLPKPGVRCHVRVEARPRVAVMSTILRAHYPVDALLWPLEVANDNEPPANDDGPAVPPRCSCAD